MHTGPTVHPTLVRARAIRHYAILFYMAVVTYLLWFAVSATNGGQINQEETNLEPKALVILVMTLLIVLYAVNLHAPTGDGPRWRLVAWAVSRQTPVLHQVGMVLLLLSIYPQWYSGWGFLVIGAGLFGMLAGALLDCVMVYRTARKTGLTPQGFFDWRTE